MREPAPYGWRFTQEGVGPVRGIRGANGGYETAESRDVWRRLDEGRGLREGAGNDEWMRCFLVRRQSFRYQRRPVDDCSPGRGGMTQDGGKRGGAFRGDMDRCRESQGWTTACRSMSEHGRKDQGEDSPKQACSC